MSRLILKYLNINLASDDLTIFHLFRRVFGGSNKDINVPSGFTLVTHSPEFDGEITIDGELYVE